MELATSKQQVHRASGFEESYQEVARELTTVQGQLESLTRDLADAHGELAERDKLVAKHKKKVADNKETIDSLKTVINDFSPLRRWLPARSGRSGSDDLVAQGSHRGHVSEH